ncbi:MAG: amidohydrolase family protein [Albidovulum sp.]|nr:amidohydrolase family protein [Albidovulum sp.]
MRIVDCHGHIFPPLAEPCGFESRAEHLLYMQWGMHTHTNQPVVRSRDGETVAEKHLWSPIDPSESGRADGLDFRVDGNGRLAWNLDGEKYHVQYLSPSTRNLESPAETIVAQMDYVGIEKMVLQNDHTYGNSAEIFAAAIAEYPGRFIGLAQVEEGFAWSDSEIRRLERQVAGNGMSGLYFTLNGFMRSGWKETYAAPSYDDFWKTVERLGIPVFWVHPGETPWGSYLEEMERFAGWLERFPRIRSVMVHGWPTAQFDDGTGRIEWPAIVQRIQDEFPVFTEILYPISWGRRHDYPYSLALNHVRQFYERFGANRMIWGSDMPNVERYCTYRQSLDYVRNHASFLSDSESEAIFSGNCLSLFERDAE